MWVGGHSRSLTMVPLESLGSGGSSQNTLAGGPPSAEWGWAIISSQWKNWGAWTKSEGAEPRAPGLEPPLSLGWVSYSPSIVKWRYLVSFARYSNLLVENREIFIPYLYSSPVRGDPVGILRRCLYRTHKNYDNTTTMSTTRSKIIRMRCSYFATCSLRERDTCNMYAVVRPQVQQRPAIENVIPTFSLDMKPHIFPQTFSLDSSTPFLHGIGYCCHNDHPPIYKTKRLGNAIPDRFANPGISGLSLLNPGIPGLIPGLT